MSKSVETNYKKLLKEQEAHSLSLILLSYLTEDDEYSELSKLVFMIDDVENFKQFIKYYGGKTIKVPTQEEVRITLKHLLLFQYVYIDGKDFEEAYKEADLDNTPEAIQKAKQNLQKFYNYVKDVDIESLNDKQKEQRKKKLF